LADKFVGATALLQAEERDKILEERRSKERINNPLDPVLDHLTQAPG
jgi:hypothetical protein